MLLNNKNRITDWCIENKLDPINPKLTVFTYKDRLAVDPEKLQRIEYNRDNAKLTSFGGGLWQLQMGVTIFTLHLVDKSPQCIGETQKRVLWEGKWRVKESTKPGLNLLIFGTVIIEYKPDGPAFEAGFGLKNLFHPDLQNPSLEGNIVKLVIGNTLYVFFQDKFDNTLGEEEENGLILSTSTFGIIAIGIIAIGIGAGIISRERESEN